MRDEQRLGERRLRNVPLLALGSLVYSVVAQRTQHAQGHCLGERECFWKRKAMGPKKLLMRENEKAPKAAAADVDDDGT